jgi:hypothetical protein
MIGGIEETSASFEARSAPRSYPTNLLFSVHPAERKIYWVQPFDAKRSHLRANTTYWSGMYQVLGPTYNEASKEWPGSTDTKEIYVRWSAGDFREFQSPREHSIRVIIFNGYSPSEYEYDCVKANGEAGIDINRAVDAKVIPMAGSNPWGTLLEPLMKEELAQVKVTLKQNTSWSKDDFPKVKWTKFREQLDVISRLSAWEGIDRANLLIKQAREDGTKELQWAIDWLCQQETEKPDLLIEACHR